MAHTALTLRSSGQYQNIGILVFCKEPCDHIPPWCVPEFRKPCELHLPVGFCFLHNGADQAVHGGDTSRNKAEWSASLQTPSSIITRGSKASLLSLSAHARASVIRQVLSTPFYFIYESQDRRGHEYRRLLLLLSCHPTDKYFRLYLRTCTLRL